MKPALVQLFRHEIVFRLTNHPALLSKPWKQDKDDRRTDSRSGGSSTLHYSKNYV